VTLASAQRQRPQIDADRHAPGAARRRTVDVALAPLGAGRHAGKLAFVGDAVVGAGAAWRSLGGQATVKRVANVIERRVIDIELPANGERAGADALGGLLWLSGSFMGEDGSAGGRIRVIGAHGQLELGQTILRAHGFGDRNITGAPCGGRRLLCRSTYRT